MTCVAREHDRTLRTSVLTDSSRIDGMFTSTGVEFNGRCETEFNEKQMDNAQATVGATKHETEMNNHMHGPQNSG